MTKFGAAQGLRRVEDPRLLVGRGRYTDDITLPGQARGYVLRSPHAAARINGIDAEAARGMPGVLAVYTAADVEADGIGGLPCHVPMKNRDGSNRHDAVHPLLAADRVRYAGQPVAFVVAESLVEARDAAEAIMVDYADLPAVGTMPAAMADGAPLVWDDAPGNVAFDWETGDKAKVDELFAKADKVVAIDLVNNRIVVASMESRACNASYDAATGRFTVYAGTQGVHGLKNQLAQVHFKEPAENFHVVTTDVGGGFGMKIFVYAEYVLCTWATRKLGRPVKWTGDRSESFLSDTHGRAQWNHAELAVDADGKFLALRVRTEAEMGAYLSSFAPFIPTMAGSKVLPSVYQTQAVYVNVRGIYTNTTWVDAYRGAGRPESNYLVERLVDRAARELGIDRIELRRRNMVRPDQMPYRNALGQNYDSGDFPAILARAVEASHWHGIAARKQEALARGKRRGIGLASYLEATGGAPVERAEIKFAADGMVEVLVGTQSTGQGHETAYTQLVVEKLGVPVERVRVVQGDSDAIPTGGGTGGAPSLYSEGGAILAVTDVVIDKGRQAAADVLEAAAADIEFKEGEFRISGTDRAIQILALAQALREKGGDDAVKAALDAFANWDIKAHTFPNGCHVAEIELDPETGVVEVVGYSVVDDMGRVLNPLIAGGQVHGGVAQGIGQALMEHTAYDENGQLLAGSFMDYGMPRADDLPDIDVAFHPVPCTTNPLGVKGAGEAGAIGAPPSVMNALQDALDEFGVHHIDMPATPIAVWNAIQAARA